MTVGTVTLFLAMLAVIAQITVVSAIGLALFRTGTPAADRIARAVVDAVGENALLLALAVALVATSGSLYFSEIAHFVPCKLCWYQRIAMYPMVPILAVALWRRDPGVRRYVVPVASIGALISTYHVLLERFPSIESGVCDPANPCTLIWVQRFGYLTIPTMALSAFALIIVLVSVARSETG